MMRNTFRVHRYRTESDSTEVVVKRNVTARFELIPAASLPTVLTVSSISSLEVVGA